MSSFTTLPSQCRFNLIWIACILWMGHRFKMFLHAKQRVWNAIRSHVQLMEKFIRSQRCLYASLKLQHLWLPWADLERWTGGPDPLPPPGKSKINIGFLSNTCPDPLKNHKTTKPVFNVGPTSSRPALSGILDPSSLHQLKKSKKNFSRLGPPLTNLSGSAHGYYWMLTFFEVALYYSLEGTHGSRTSFWGRVSRCFISERVSPYDWLSFLFIFSPKNKKPEFSNFQCEFSGKISTSHNDECVTQPRFLKVH